MSIVEFASSSSGRRGRASKWNALAGGTLVAAAIFVASPKLAHGQIVYRGTGGSSTDPNNAAAQSWFNVSNWSNISTPPAGPTGTLPESYAGGSTADIDANNATMPTVGVVFDPRDDNNTPGGPNTNYEINLQNIPNGTLYISSLGGTVAAPNKLTIESGTIIAQTITIGRDSAGILALNGGTLIVDANMKIQGANKTTTMGSGTFEYHGGTVESLQGYQVAAGVSASGGLYNTSAGVGTFVVYNDGPDGAILSNNGLIFSANSNNAGTTGIVEFHYDLNTGGIGGTRPIQTNWNNTVISVNAPGKLQILNNTNLSSRLNLVLDASPGHLYTFEDQEMGLGKMYVNLGLFDDTIITGSGTFPKAFYSVDGSTLFTQGATITATYAGIDYSWTISYSGQIHFTNTATSAYNSSDIQATGGNDVVLIGITALVPEPSSLALLGSTGALILSRRRGRKEKKSA
jgi:hypothetical protein